MKRVLLWLIRLIGPALLIFFLWNSDWNAIIATFAAMQWWPFLLSLALFIGFVVVKSWRWNLLMRELGMQPPPLSFSMALYTIGLYAGGLTPGQSGDFIKGWYLRERGLPLASSLFSIVLDRLFDFLVMALLALLGLLIFLDDLPQGAGTATIAFAVVMVTLTPALMARRPREWTIGLFLPILPGRLRDLAIRLRDQFAPLDLRPAPAILLLVATSLSASFTMIRVYLLYVALSLTDIPLLAVVGSTALIAILQALPISFSGVGVRDAILIALLARYGHAPEIAISLSALFLLINIEHIILGFLVSLRYPLTVAQTGANAEDRQNEQD